MTFLNCGALKKTLKMDGGKDTAKSIAELKAAGRMKQKTSPRKQPAVPSSAGGDELDDIAVEIMGMSISERPKEVTVSRTIVILISMIVSDHSTVTDVSFRRILRSPNEESPVSSSIRGWESSTVVGQILIIPKNPKE